MSGTLYRENRLLFEMRVSYPVTGYNLQARDGFQYAEFFCRAGNKYFWIFEPGTPEEEKHRQAQAVFDLLCAAGEGVRE